MKRRTKIGLSLAAVTFGAVALSGCTKSFCSQVDYARMKYAFEPGISVIAPKEGGETLTFTDGTNTYTIANAQYVVATWVMKDTEVPHVGEYALQYTYDTESGPKEVNKKLNYLNSIIKASRDAGYVTIDDSCREYLMRFDYLAMHSILTKAAASKKEHVATVDLMNPEQLATFNRDVSFYSYARFVVGEYKSSWTNWDTFDRTAREDVDASSPIATSGKFSNLESLSPDVCPSSDYINLYKSKVNGYVSTYRTCLTTHTDKYGSYGYSAEGGIFVEKKSWSYAWSKGFFEGLLVYPIGALIDALVVGFRGTGVTDGAAALLGIVFVTFIIRALMLLLTFKQTQSNAKMTELQPEIQKIQNKYPNSNTSQVEKQRMAEEMNRLYKKNKVNPFMTLLVLVVQFPVFICVWGALSGSAALTNGTVLGLNLSMTIKDALFTKSLWTAAGGYAAVTALFLFLLMAGAQTVSMLLPQWIQKSKAKKVAKLGKNPAQKSQNNKMKWFTYIMLALIIFMGFSLVSAMGIYWFIGAVFSVVQTIITTVITERKKKNN